MLETAVLTNADKPNVPCGLHSGQRTSFWQLTTKVGVGKVLVYAALAGRLTTDRDTLCGISLKSDRNCGSCNFGDFLCMEDRFCFLEPPYLKCE